MKTETRLILTVFGVWFAIALLIGLTGAFEHASASAVALTVWGLTAFVLLVAWKISSVKHWAMNIDLSWLIGLHFTRFVGFYFLVLCKHDELACRFARPAGIGDAVSAIGAATLLLWPLLHGRRPSKPWIDIWNVFGFIDIILVVFTAFRVGLSDWPGMAALRSLPLMLLPTFFVPLIIASHILIFVRLRKS